MLQRSVLGAARAGLDVQRTDVVEGAAGQWNVAGAAEGERIEKLAADRLEQPDAGAVDAQVGATVLVPVGGAGLVAGHSAEVVDDVGAVRRVRLDQPGAG